VTALGLDDTRATRDAEASRTILWHFSPSTVGTIDELNSLTAEKTRQLVKEHFNLSETIFSVAGKYDFDAVVEQMEGIFGAAPRGRTTEVKCGQRKGGYLHIHNDGAQVHIGLMTETVKPTDKNYYNARMAVSVLSGGMSARLFTEVREKRGLLRRRRAVPRLKRKRRYCLLRGYNAPKGTGDHRLHNRRI
jgi:predicted Zn-dependent peptidase